MNRNRLSVCAAFALLSLPAQAAKVTWEPYMELGNDVFPSLLISTATVDWHADEDEEEDAAMLLGDPNGWFGVAVDGVEQGSKVTVEVSGDAWVKPSKIQVTVDDDPDGETIYVQPKIIYDYDLLSQVRQQKPTNLTFKVTVDGKKLGE